MMTNINFITILCIGLIDYLGIALVYPVFAAMLFDPEFPIVPPESSAAYRGVILGLLIGLAPFTQFFSAPLLGAVSDVKGRKITLIFGTLTGVIAYCSAILGVCLCSLPLLFLYRFLVGISTGTMPVAQAMISDITPDEMKARRFSLFSASAGVGFTIGPFLGGKLADPALGSWCGYASPFVAACAMCLLSLIVVIARFPETLKVRQEMKFNILGRMNNIGKVFLWKEVRWLFIATFAFAFGWSFFNEFVPVLLRNKFNFSLSEIGNYFAYGGAWYAVSSGVIAVAVLKRFKAEEVAVKALVGSAVCMLLYLGIEDGGPIWFILPVMMLCISFIFPTTASLISSRAGAENQGEVLGVYQSVVGFAMGVSPLVAGSAVGMYPSLTAIGGAAAMAFAGLAFRRGTRNEAVGMIL